jgi:hypothetical protein
MKKHLILLTIVLLMTKTGSAWWDPGHMVVAMIAYLNLTESAREEVDRLTKILEQDYAQVNHFMVTGPWPDDLKEDEVRTYDHWHYTNLPYNPYQLPLPPLPEINAVWAIRQMQAVLSSQRAADVEKARHLAFLVHIVGDLHQPLHSTTMYSPQQPEGNLGGNQFRLSGKWNNLHALWDDACGLTSEYGDIRPYGQTKEPLNPAQIQRIESLAATIMEQHPKSSLPILRELDPDAWALESHDLAVEHAYRALIGMNDDGSPRYLQPNDTPPDDYLQRGQEVAKKRLALAGYRLAEILNQLFGDS